MCLCCFLLALSGIFEEGTFFEVTRMREAAGLAKKEKRLLAFLVGLLESYGVIEVLLKSCITFFFPLYNRKYKVTDPSRVLCVCSYVLL